MYSEGPLGDRVRGHDRGDDEGPWGDSEGP